MRTNFDKNQARLQFQAADMLNKHNNGILEEQINQEKKDKDMIMESAYSSIGSYIYNKRVKEQDNERRFNYANHFTELALTEALSECVEKALLLNTDEYAKLNPVYKEEIHNTVSNFLTSSSINEEINNEFVNVLFEAIKEEMPPADLYLTEEQEREIVVTKIMPKETINNSIDSLIGDVRARVANIVSKDQEALAAEQKDMEYIENKELEAAPLAPVEPEPYVDDVVADPEMEQNEPIEPAPMAQEQPVMESFNNKRLTIVKEQQKKGIFECLALNEATQMIAEGKEYDKTLALANAIKYITVLETLDASGVVTIGQNGYNRILSASGVNMNPVSKVDIPGANIVDTPVTTDAVDASPVKIDLPNESPKEVELRNKISDIVKTSIPCEFTLGCENKIFEPFEKWKAESKTFGSKLADIPVVHERAEVMYKGIKGDILTESQLRAKFEREGFDLDYVDFDDLARDWHYIKK